jgi:SAM-dependent methyltransferase
VAFKQYVRAEIAAGLDETYQFEPWAAAAPGSVYYDVHVAVIEERETCVPTLRRALGTPGKRILESGCGSGRWMAYFERLGHRAFGIDDSAAPLRVARAHDADLRLIHGDALQTPFRDASFDVVFSSYVAEHFEDGPQTLLREIHRLLKPDGLLILVVPYDSTFRRLFTHRVLQAFYRLCRWRGRPLAFTEFRYSRRDVETFLQRCHFRVEHVEPDDFRLPWAKGLSLDLGALVLQPGESWQLNRFGRALARVLDLFPLWTRCAGILVLARRLDAPAGSDASQPSITMPPSTGIT